MTDTLITIIGNLVADPELRFTPAGAAVATLHRRVHAAHVRQAGERVEGREARSCAARCGVRRRGNVAESLSRGSRVIVTGKLKSRTFETREGEKRTSSSWRSTRSAPASATPTATVNKANRGGGG
ncbi:single-stranded DNA-binding protein [Rhodococcus hoagii]|nr:single-stranded DNA-binding protein [Prescottella equi]